jgi:nitrite reductase/ring-hydroxylating ferredoxin subunit
MFVLALAHGILAVVQFHGFGDTNPLVSVFTAYAEDYDPFLRQPAAVSRFPFEPLGFLALVILFLMAATSHDFWLKNLGASWWKRLHLLVLVAYGLVVLHIAFGALQSERNPVLVAFLMAALVAVYGLHLAAGWREAVADRRRIEVDHDGRVRAVAVDDLVDGRATVVWIGSERVAVWRHRDRIFATANVCRHQGGPLGEGLIVGGCITCPWHGWQYRPEDGQSPPPFDERIPTYRAWVVDGDVWLDPEPDQPGTPQPGAPLDGEVAHV